MSISSMSHSIGSFDSFHMPWDIFHQVAISTTIKAYQVMCATVTAGLDWEEDTFTVQLKDYIRKQISEEGLPIEAEAHVKVHTPEMRRGKKSVKEASEIDLKLYRPLDLQRDDFYFAWECKLLGIKNKDHVGRYISNGIMRFINSEYSSQRNRAGMIGYVEDGEIDVLATKINASMIRKKLSPDNHLLKADSIEVFPDIYLSHHKRVNGTEDIKLHHLFMTFVWEPQ